MSASLARFLRDFSEPELPQAAFAQSAAPAMDFDIESLSVEPDEPPVDIEAERAEAYAEGRTAAEEELRAEYEARIAALEEAHRNELETMKADNAAALSAISGRVEAVREEIVQEVSAAALDALLPLVDEMLVAKAIENLASQIRDAFSADDAVELVVHGPQDLVGLLEAALGEAGFKLRHKEAAGPDLTVENGEMIFATRLSAWVAGVRELLQ